MSSQTPRPRAVTNNALTSKTSPALTPSASTSAGRRPSQSSKPAANRQNSALMQKKGFSTSPSRSRSQSSSHRAGNMDSAYYSQFDADSKPPWLDQSTLLYKSDILAPEPGSLADIARHAQSKMNGSAAMEEAGNTSTRSWDDVILPAVAKQIRAQQRAEALQREAESVKRAKMQDVLTRSPTAESSRPPRGQEQRLEPIPTAILPADLKEPPDNAVRPPDPPNLDAHPSRSRSYRERTASRAPHPAASNLSLVPSSTASQPQSARTHHTGRRELWQQSALASPTTAKGNGFGQAQQQQGFAAMSGQAHARPATAKSLFIPEKQSEKLLTDEQHGKKGCCCIVM